MPSSPTPIRAMLLPACLLIALAAAIVVPIVAIQLARPLPQVERMRDFDDLRVPSEWADQALFHRPLIHTMHEQWPAIEIVEYDSATAPGYHAMMATVLRITGGSHDPDRRAPIAPVLVLNLLIGLALVGAVYFFAAGAAGPWPAFFLCLPIATSKYILGATAFLTTDNLAWLLIAIALGLATFSRARPAHLLGAGLVVAGAVGVRQIMLWGAGPVVLAGLLASPLVRFVPRPLLNDPNAPADDEDRPWKPLIFACIGSAIAFALLAVFVVLWGGLVPQASEFVRIHAAGPNLATPAFLLALTGACAVFFVPLIWPEFVGFLKRPLADLPALVAIVLGAASAILVKTAPTMDMPRDTQLWKARAYGWLWEIARRTPDVAERSLVIVAGAATGALALLLLWRAARRAGYATNALILLIALLAFACAQTMNTMAWQRYFEPIVLIALAWLGAILWPSTWKQASTLHRRVMLAGPTILATLLMALSLLLLIRPMLQHWSA
ncbi:MAG: hypothetical protein ACNA8P_07680 [Phycisphaerales bacterium]